MRRPVKAAAQPSARRGAGAALADQARILIEDMIIKLELPPGSVWSEAELSRQIGIGRTPVREALQRLEANHLVAIVPRFGARIAEIDVMQQLLLLEVRRELERLIAASAARRATAEERKKLLAIADELEAVGENDVLRFLRLFYDYKRFESECARNPFAARAIAPCHAISRRFYYLHYRQEPDVPVAARHHTDVIRAVAFGDVDKARAASDRLMDYVEQLTRATALLKL